MHHKKKLQKKKGMGRKNVPPEPINTHAMLDRYNEENYKGGLEAPGATNTCWEGAEA